MKKLFLFSVAALAFCACSSDETVSENSAANQQPKEISFAPLNKVNTRTSNDYHGYINGTTFDTGWGMTVSAVDVANSTSAFFAATDFAYDATPTLWKGSPARYWPLSPVQINFLAIAHANADNTTGVSWTNSTTSHQVTVAVDNYAKTAQYDLVYAIGHGQVTQNGNALSFPTKVDMIFKHAQAYLVFNLKAADDASKAITITNVELQNVWTKGTATIARTNPSTYADNNTNLTWDRSAGNSEAASFRSITYTASNTTEVQGVISQPLTTGFVETGHLLVIPNMTTANTPADNAADTKLKISYTLNGNPYTYVYTIDNDTYDAGKKYIYNITFKLHEIFIDPVVTDWVETGNTTNIYIPSVAYNESGATVGIGATAGYYTFTISDVPANGGSSYDVVADGSTIIDTIEKTDDSTTSSEKGNITIKVKSKGGAANATETFKLKLGGTEKMTVTLQLKTTL